MTTSPPNALCDYLLGQLLNIPTATPSLLDKQAEHLRLILQRSCTSVENSSVLVIGPQGSGECNLFIVKYLDIEHIIGKSLLVNHSLQSLLSISSLKYQVIHIRGNWITTETSCIQQIQSQFGRIEAENAMNNDSDDDMEDQEDDVTEDTEDKINSNLLYLEEKLQEGKRNHICTIIVIDKMEVACAFAKRTLYHIANASHMKEANLLIIGISSQYNIDQKMDKRIHSRLQSRKLFTHLPRTAEDIRTIFIERLALDQNRKFDENTIKMFNESLEQCLNNPSVTKLLQKSQAFGDINFLMKWMKFIVQELRGSGSTVLSVEHFEKTYQYLTTNSALSMISDLTIYELCMLITVKRLEEYGSSRSTTFTAYNFETLFNEYTKFITGGANSSNIQDQDVFRDKLLSTLSVNRTVLLTAFEKLIELDLIKLTGKSKHVVDTGKGRKRDVSKVTVRLNRLHPSEIERYFKENKSVFPSEIFKFVTEM
jgi:hypothetical protein